MFVDNTDDGRGQVGIGTLIVFIAMVLVAAIAAGVLINTAGFLQSQAEATGEESTDLVSERIDVTSTVGIVDDADDGTLEEIRIAVTGAAGASEIDLNRTIVQVVGPDGQDNYVLGTDGGDEIAGLESNEFAALDSDDDFEDLESAVIDDDNGDFVLLFDPSGGAFDDGDAFGTSDEASLTIVSPSGATTEVELNAPDIFTTNGEAVRL